MSWQATPPHPALVSLGCWLSLYIGVNYLQELEQFMFSPSAFTPNVATFSFNILGFSVIYRLRLCPVLERARLLSLSLTQSLLFAYPLIRVLSPHFLLARCTWLFCQCAGFASCLDPLQTCENDPSQGRRWPASSCCTRPQYSSPPRKFLRLEGMPQAHADSPGWPQSLHLSLLQHGEL